MWLPTARAPGRETGREPLHSPPSPSAPAAPARKPIYFVLSLFSERAETGSGRRPRLLQPLPAEPRMGVEASRGPPSPGLAAPGWRQEALPRPRAGPPPPRPHLPRGSRAGRGRGRATPGAGAPGPLSARWSRITAGGRHHLRPPARQDLWMPGCGPLAQRRAVPTFPFGAGTRGHPDPRAPSACASGRRDRAPAAGLPRGHPTGTAPGHSPRARARGPHRAGAGARGTHPTPTPPGERAHARAHTRRCSHESQTPKPLFQTRSGAEGQDAHSRRTGG